jgi:hypothetical protein
MFQSSRQRLELRVLKGPSRLGGEQHCTRSKATKYKSQECCPFTYLVFYSQEQNKRKKKEPFDAKEMLFV